MQALQCPDSPPESVLAYLDQEMHIGANKAALLPTTKARNRSDICQQENMNKQIV